MGRLFFLSIFMFAFVSCDQSSRTEPKKNEDLQIQTRTVGNKLRVLFVQWQYPDSIDPIKALDIRHKTENLIDGGLRSANLGYWIAGDLGPGGANMLFEVNDTARALSFILDNLKKASLETQTLIAIDNGIAQRGAQPSNFSVIYPENFTGDFNDW